MARPRSDIDPRRLDAGERPKRRRKPRSRPDPKPTLKAAQADAEAKLYGMPMSPGVMLEPDGEGYRITAPHNDPALWEVQMAAAFGTRSIALVETFLRQLKSLCPKDWDEDRQAWKTNETEWNALLALVSDHRPDNATQAALAAQMAAVHLMQMRVSAQALNKGYMVLGDDAALASKLARTYAQLCETMHMLKGKKRPARQKITVKRESHHHQHIHVHRGGEGSENHAQPDEPRRARAVTVEGCAALPSPPPIRPALSSASDERQEGLPQARGRKLGRTEGQGER